MIILIPIKLNLMMIIKTNRAAKNGSSIFIDKTD